jgi:hypothetical protein
MRIGGFAIGLWAALCAALGGCLSKAPVRDVSELARSYPAPDTFLGEKLHKGEVEDAQALIDTLAAEVRNEAAKTGHARRDAHSKAHGCVRGTFTVNADLPAEMAHGVFKPGASYAAKIRYSNGTPRAAGQDQDIRGDMRGMAVKLYGVPGQKLFSLPGRELEHDFILISKPYFFFSSTHDYAGLFKLIERGGLWSYVRLPFLLGPRASYNAWRMLRQSIANPLEARYWSLVAYQLGTGDQRVAVKYSAVQCTAGASTIPKNPGPNYLREAMVRSLETAPACFDFMVQRRRDPDLSVENVLVAWPEDDRAPFQNVARLTIPPQRFDTPEQNSDCENESFNPWQALPEHKPLGNINRTRRVLYEAASRLRHDLNHAAVPNEH